MINKGDIEEAILQGLRDAGLFIDEARKASSLAMPEDEHLTECVDEDYTTDLT